MEINTKKTKEMLIYFGKKIDKETVASVTLDNDQIDRVDTFKLLGVIFSSDLSWGPHVSYLLGKVSKRYYLIFQLARLGVAPLDIISIYCAIIRSILEYACAVWHSGLTTTQSNDIERVQRRCLRIIYPDLSYHDALSISGLDRLCVRRENIVRDTFKDIRQPKHVLHNLLPAKRNPKFNSRYSYPYSLPVARTQRYSNSFLAYCIRKRY